MCMALAAIEKKSRLSRTGVLSAIAFAALSMSHANAQPASLGSARADDWRRYDAGAVSFQAPPSMRAPGVDEGVLRPVGLVSPSWTFTLTEDPARPDRATTVTLQWSADVDPDEMSGAVQARAATTVDGRGATRIEWRDADMKWRGVDLLVPRAATTGEALKVSCHALENRWSAARETCERIVSSVRLARATPTGGPSVAQGPRDEGKAGPQTGGEKASAGGEKTSAGSAAPDSGLRSVSSPAPAPPRRQTVFSGALDARWIRFQAHGGDAKAFLKEDGGAVVADVPAGHGWGRTGIRTAPEHGLFLDDFGPESRIEATLRFDPARTSAFGVALTPNGAGCEGGALKGVYFTFAPSADGKSRRAEWFDPYEQARGRHGVSTSREGISELRISVTDGRAVVRADSLPALAGDFVDARPGARLEFCVFSQGGTENAAGTMALREIVVDRSPPATPPSAAPGVAALPVSVAFGRGARVQWEPLAPERAETARAVALGAEGATVDANIGGEGYVGIWSRTPFVDFDPFSAAAPYRYLLEFDPARTGDFEVRLILPRVIDIRGQYLVAGRETKAGAAQLYVGYCRPGEAIRRPFPASWDGRFEIVLFAGRFLVGPPGGPKIGCEEGMFSQDREHWMAILAPLRPPGGGSGFALRSIVRTRIAPEGMTATERPKFASDEPFDADSFVKAAAKALFGAPGKGTSHGEK